jgi:signal transduction histidine kinase
MALPVLNQFLVLLINLLGTFLGVTVYRRQPEGAVNRIFLVTIILMLLWVDFAYAPRLIGRANPDLALFCMRIAWTATPLFSTSLYFLTIYLTHCQSSFQTLHWAVGGLGLSATFLAGFTDLVVDGIHVIDDSIAIDYGPGMWPFLGIITLIVAATGLAFYWSYSTLPPKNRLQLQYVGIGLLIFYVANIVFNISLPMFFGIVRWYWLGDYSTLTVLGLTAYAIVKKELFGIRVVLTALLVALIALLLVVDVVVFTEGGFPRIVKGLVLLTFLYFGYMLVQSVHREIAQREELQDIAAELQRSDDAKTEFLSIVSHQLRSPLNAIKGYLSLLLEGTYGSLDRQKRTPMERLYQSNERLIHLVNDLLGVSQIQMGKIEMEAVEVDLCKVARSVVEEFSNAAGEKGIELKATCAEPALPPIVGDTQKLRDSVMNLVDNAIRYTDKGSVEVSVRREDDDIVVQVRDTGAGIDQRDARALFESFQRGDVGRKRWTEGTGLGLYIAQQFVTLHGGKIWVESAGKGMGSSFFIRLPLPGRQQAA